MKLIREYLRGFQIFAACCFLAFCICAFACSIRPAMEIFLVCLCLWIWIGIKAPEGDNDES